MTTVADAARLLALASAYDSRRPDDARVHAWADALANLDPNDCADAIRRHYRVSTDFVMPAHIRRLVAQYSEPERGTWKQLQPANPVPMPDFVRQTLDQITTRPQCEHGCLEKPVESS